jgi:hypothetical protein
MINPVSTSPPAQPVAAPTPTTHAAAEPKAQANASRSDTVNLSSAGQAALKEATETPAQTTHEAHVGDRQAIRLLAKETAARNQK